MNLLCLIGLTGCGKTYIRDNILCKDHNDRFTFKQVLQVTTRERRDDEINNPNTYLFVNNETYDALCNDNQLFAITNFNENKYGTLKQMCIDKEDFYNVIIANAEGYKQICKELKDNSNANIFAIYVSSDDCENHFKLHNNRTEEQIQEEMKALNSIIYDACIKNDKNCRANYEDIIQNLIKSGVIYNG
jgi:guanylate kinase